MKRRFFFHYRRSSGGMTVHYRGLCLPCKEVVCEVPVETKHNSRQPRLVLRGYAHSVEVINETCYIR